MRFVPLLLFAVLSLLLIIPHSCLNNGLSLIPPRGYNGYNSFPCRHMNETNLRAQSAQLIALGLRDLGYNYYVIDDCWEAPERDNKTGKLYADPTVYPSGMAAIGDYLHSNGLLYGIYSSASSITCRGLPGSLDHEVLDANTFINEWNIDFLKYDNCKIHPPWANVTERYTRMYQALNQTQSITKPIVFSLSEAGILDPKSIAQQWRTTSDIKTDWSKIMLGVELNNLFHKYAGPHGWNDPDILEVGVINAKGQSLTWNENRAHFCFWVLMKSPMMLSMDLTQLTRSNPIYQLISNRDILSIHDDILGVQGFRLNSFGDHEKWAIPLSTGSIAVMLFNRALFTVANASITIEWTDLSLPANRSLAVYDLFQHRYLTQSQTNGFTVNNIGIHDVAFLRLDPVKSEENEIIEPLIELSMDSEGRIGMSPAARERLYQSWESDEPSQLSVEKHQHIIMQQLMNNQQEKIQLE